MAEFPTPPNGKTVAAVIGDPVLHSLSPTIYNAAFEHDEVDWIYTAINVSSKDVGSLMQEMRVRQVGGLSVTMPHKDIAAKLVDETTPHAQKLGVVNCISKEGSSLCGHNTDGEGFLRSLQVETGERVAGKSLMIIGAGGAARAISLALGESGAKEVILASRDDSKSESAASLAGAIGRIGTLSESQKVDVIINATPIGMGATGNEGHVPLPMAGMHKNQIIVDLIYHPLETTFLKRAREVGARTMNGIGMLIHQAALQYALWTQKEAPLDVMYDAVMREISQ